VTPSVNLPAVSKPPHREPSPAPSALKTSQGAPVLHGRFTTPTQQKEVTMTTLKSLLDSVVRTGQVPTLEEIAPLITRGTKDQRDRARKSIRRACREIAAAKQQQHPDAAAQLAQDATETFGPYTAAGEAVDVSSIPFRPAGTSNARAKFDRQALAPLRDLFARAACGETIYRDEIESLNLVDATPEETLSWRTQVAKAAEEANRYHAAGQFGNASAFGQEAALSLGHMLRPGSPDRTPDDVNDPRQLAALIMGS